MFFTSTIRPSSSVRQRVLVGVAESPTGQKNNYRGVRVCVRENRRESGSLLERLLIVDIGGGREGSSYHRIFRFVDATRFPAASAAKSI